MDDRHLYHEQIGRHGNYGVALHTALSMFGERLPGSHAVLPVD